jgi:Tfp pilus assembly protein PilZ
MSRPLIVVGAFRRRQEADSIQEAASTVGASVSLVERCEDAPRVLSEVAQPAALLMRMDAEGVGQAFARIRAQARFAQLPILGVAPQRDDLAFTELFSWGGDDLLALASPNSLARRLRPLVARPAAPREPKREPAVVAGADAQWRSVMGRALYQGGFSARFVTSAQELAAQCLAEGLRVVVVTDDLGAGGPEAALAAARERGSTAAWVLVVPPKRMPVVHAAVASLGPASVADGFAAPENVLFLTNELLNRRGVDQRASVRMLYGTAVAFRLAGRDEDDIGFSYNVSAGGLYVRTLAPLDAGQELWLELWPPRSERRVRLAGTVAWKRPFGPTEGATVPAGFGVKITEGLAGDLDRWRGGYDSFAASIFGMRAAKPQGTQG